MGIKGLSDDEWRSVAAVPRRIQYNCVQRSSSSRAAYFARVLE